MRVFKVAGGYCISWLGVVVLIVVWVVLFGCF